MSTESRIPTGKELVTSIPLFNFMSDIEEADLGAGMKLHRLPNQSDDMLRASISTFLGEHRPPSVLMPDFGITTVASAGGRPVTGVAIVGEAQLFVTALRLHKAGDVMATLAVESLTGTLRLEFERGEDDPKWYTPTATFNRELLPQRNVLTYTLLASELPQVLRLRDHLRQLGLGSQQGALSTPLRRLDRSYMRETGEDMVIDLTIALESSLLRGVRDELRYRLAMRGAALLAPEKTAGETAAFLLATYEVRSLIVHEGLDLSEGSILKILGRLDPPIDFRDLPQRVQDIVRQILKSYVDRLVHGASINDVNAQLDRQITDSLTSAAYNATTE